ncbi:MAG: UDP-glucose/GDP-mannose dehydrogenase family protein [Longimicrobiales bacterium]|nr:UDP-glucose/GDP-mannose dehydrogenase family protein [Longimicrobiales bacterium]
MRVAVIGTGYVGIVSGACLAEAGHEVVCVDVDPEKVDRINAGRAPIHEAGLDELLHRNVGTRLRATTDLRRAVLDAELSLICVGTPSTPDGIDLRYVLQCARDIGTVLRETERFHAVVVKSTVVPGTTDGPVTAVLEEASGKVAGRDFGVGMNPEFLTEGQAVRDFARPDRIVLGASDARTLQALERLYEAFPDTPTLRVNPRTAEMIKYASNAMLATQISFANEIANLCAALGGIDVTEVTDGVHLSGYLSPLVPGSGDRVRAPLASFLEAGCGFGGSCLPKDVTALAAQGREVGTPMPVLEAVLATNRAQPGRMLDLLRIHYPDLTGVRVTVLGLAFKPDTDDMRESPAIPILRELVSAGARVRAYDPVAMDAAREALPDLPLAYAPTLEDAVAEADALVLVTRWAEFQRVAERVAELDPQPVVVDGRRVLDPKRFERYEGIGVRREPSDIASGALAEGAPSV